MAFISDIVKSMKSPNSDIDTEIHDGADYNAITQVFAFAKGSILNYNSSDTPEGQKRLKESDAEDLEKKRILRKHWFKRLTGSDNEEIFAMYGRNEYGNRINVN